MAIPTAWPESFMAGGSDRISTLSNALALAENMHPDEKTSFTAKGLVVFRRSVDGVLILEDESGRVKIYNPHFLPGSPGDIVSVSGFACHDGCHPHPYLAAGQIRILEHTTPISPTKLELADIAQHVGYQLITTSGHVVSAKNDEIDPRWIYITLQDKLSVISAFVPYDDHFSKRLGDLIEAKVEVTGIVSRDAASGRRRFLGKNIILSKSTDMKILDPAPIDIFAAKPLENLDGMDPAEIRTLSRRKTSGMVLSTWSGSRFLLKDDKDAIFRIELLDNRPLPRPGEDVEVVGFPETDLFHINLTRSVFRTLSKPSRSKETAKSIIPEEILFDTNGTQRIDTQYHGKLISVKGIIRTLPSFDAQHFRFNLECGRLQIPVDVSSNPTALDDITIGTTAEVSGICVMESPNWQSTLALPSLTGFMIVPRQPSDIRILSRPTWWTTSRLLIVIAALLLGILAITIWNRILNQIIIRRSRQLMRQEIKCKSAEWRVSERTRLAVELHDSLSQNLSGLACQITAVRKTLPTTAEAAINRLNIAERMLTSSRTELKRCLWDLRGNALNCRNMTESIISTVTPVLDNAELIVRFSIARIHLLETTAHTILCIVRELASNAVRHGHATRIQIAGAEDKEIILFSVRDNGCGFDIEHHAGIEDGHFGLEGVRERVDRLGGVLSIKSYRGSGTVVRISIPHSANTADPLDQ